MVQHTPGPLQRMGHLNEVIYGGGGGHNMEGML